MPLILHNYRRCPFCIRVRIVLYLLGVEHEIVEEPLRTWTEWMQEKVASGEIDKARVPILRIVAAEGAERIMPESNAINVWLDTEYGGSFVPDDVVLVDEMGAWWGWCDTVFKPQIDVFKYGKDMQFAPEEHPENTRILSDMMQKIEDALEDRKFLLGDAMTLTDIAIIPFVRQIMRTRNTSESMTYAAQVAGAEFDFTPFPRTVAWAGEILDQPWFETTIMAKQK